MQAFTLGDFPAPMSLGAITSLIGAFMTTIVQELDNHRPKAGRLLASSGDLIGYFILVIIPLSHHFIGIGLNLQILKSNTKGAYVLLQI